MNLNEEYWTGRYRQNQTGWDLGEISPPLKNYIDQLENKKIKILIPGAGNAYEAEYLFSHGFKNVFVLDFAIEPLDALIQRLPDFPKENLVHKNFFELDDSFDLILEQTFFCALNPSQRNNYILKMADLLKPGGKLTGVLFNISFSHPGPPFGGSKEDYLELFEPVFEIQILETCNNSIGPRRENELFFIFKKK